MCELISAMLHMLHLLHTLGHLVHYVQVPVADEGRMLVDPSYIQKYLVDFGNDKMQANWSRTDRLHNLFQDILLNQQVLATFVIRAA